MNRKKEITETIKQFVSFGYCAFYYPRKNKVSLNGGRLISPELALRKMKDIMQINISKQLYKGELK